MKLTPTNVQSVLGVQAKSYIDVLPQVFAALLEPGQQEMVLHNYTAAIYKKFRQDERPDGHMGFDRFGKAAFKSGIVKTMLTLTQDTRVTQGYATASFQALDSIINLMRLGTTDERRLLLDDCLKHDMVQICLDKAMHHPLMIHRNLGANALRSLASESFLGERLTTQQTSEIMIKMCQFTLAGPAYFVSQMADPVTTWQSCMLFDRHGTPAKKAAEYAPRYYAMAQENAMWVVQGLLCRSPSPSQRFCHEVLSHNPELIDLLLECSALERPPWYPDSSTNSIASECIAMFYGGTSEAVPFVTINLEDKLIQSQLNAEIRATNECSNLFVLRSGWVEKLMKMWKRVEDEKVSKIKRLFAEVVPKYHALTPLDEEEFLQVFEGRGSTRICAERIIATLTLTLFNDPASISDGDLISLLHIGHKASQHIKTMEQSLSTSDTYLYLERAVEVFRSPVHTVFTQEKVDPPEQIADESVLGPTALLGLLSLLASRGVLENIPTLQTLPAGVTAGTNLTEVKDIAGYEGIRRVLLLAVRRVTARRETGHKRFREGELDYAGFAYSTAAELAAAVIAFNSASKGKYKDFARGAAKELILCMGNAAEMALGLEQYAKAFLLATGAVASEKHLTAQDSVDESIKSKNRRRIDRAHLGLMST